MWATARPPVVFLSIDIGGLIGTVDQLIADGIVNPGDVQIAEYPWLPNEEGVYTQESAIETRDRFEADTVLAAALEGTVVVDKETQVWEMYRFAEFGAQNAADVRREYGPLNTRYDGWINKLKGYDCNVGLIEEAKEVWKGHNRTDTYEPVGYRTLAGLMYVDIYHFEQDQEHMFRIGKCKHNSSLQWQTIGATTFAELGTLLVPGSEESDWL